MIARSVLVTGGNRGLGLGLVKELLVAGQVQHLFVGCRQPNQATELQKLANEHKNVHILELDVTKLETIEHSVQQVSDVVQTSGLNCLINNAGIMDSFKPITEVTADSLANLHHTNVIGPFLVTQQCLPLLRCASSSVSGDDMSVSRAAVVNMSSILGSIEVNNIGRNYGYRMSKAALNMFTKNLSVELKQEKILCTSIHPGWVRTDMGGEKASLSVERSIKGVLNVLSSLGASDTGSFYGYDGKEIDW